MKDPRQQSSKGPPANAPRAICITLLAVNDDAGEARVMRVLLSTSDGTVLAALEDREENERATLERAGFADCISSQHFFVDPKEYERVLARGRRPASPSA